MATPGRHFHINEDKQYREWVGTVQDGTPDGPKLHSITIDPRDPLGLYFSTTSGELWMSPDEGKKWSCIARNLPEIYAVEVAESA